MVVVSAGWRAVLDGVEADFAAGDLFVEVAGAVVGFGEGGEEVGGVGVEVLGCETLGAVPGEFGLDVVEDFLPPRTARVVEAVCGPAAR